MKPIVTLLLCLLLAACSSEPSVPTVRPGVDPGTGEPSKPEDTELADALADSRQRVEAPTITLSYDDCGVIFGRTAAGALYCVDIADGRRVDFNPSAETLSINGKSVDVASVDLARHVGTTSWWVISLAEPTAGRVFYVTDF